MHPLEISIGVGGRFHADRMAAALMKAGHSVHLFTTLPKNRFPNIPSISSYLWPEIVFRAYKKLGWEYPGAFLKMELFGRKLARDIKQCDLLISWSSFGLEALQRKVARKSLLVRDSAHIRFQVEVLTREFEKQGVHFSDHQTCIAREEQEYLAADSILLPSEFAKKTFIDCGVPASKLHVVSLGTDLSLFHPEKSPKRSGPLKVVYFGALSIQKGVHYLLEATKSFSPAELEVVLIGNQDKEFGPILKKYPHAQWHSSMPQAKLSEFIREHDVFAFPSLHDGFGMAVPQAMASGLVPIVSDRCGASELIQHGKNGFVIPAGNAEALRAALERLQKNRDELERLKGEGEFRELDWLQYDKKIAALVDNLS